MRQRGKALSSETTEREIMGQSFREEHTVLREILATIPYFVFWKDREFRYLGCNEVFAKNAGLSSPADIVGLTDFDLPWGETEAADYRADDESVMSTGVANLHIQETQLTADGEAIYLDTSKAPLRNENGTVIGVIGIYVNITEQISLEVELAQARKLESIGQLAAGIAHESNTPIQFVGDNTRFLKECFSEISPILSMAKNLANAVNSGTDATELAERLESAIKDADFEFLDEEIPRATCQALDGIDRIQKIVQSLKEFSHPGVQEMTPIDLNRSIENTITVATNEWRYVAEVKTDLDPMLPMVSCFPGEINQVILNIIVNAAHAIAEVQGNSDAGVGTITITSQRANAFAEVRITDTGPGISEEVRDKIFDPFFTTKECNPSTPIEQL